MSGLDDHWRFRFPLIEPRPHGLNVSLNSLGRFDAIVAYEQMLFKMLDFLRRERAEQIRFQHLIIGVPPRHHTHSSTPLLVRRFFGASVETRRRWRFLCINNTRRARQIPERKLTCIQRFTPFGTRLNASQRNLSRIRRCINSKGAELQ